MASLVVSPNVINVTDINQNTVTVNFTCDKTLTDVKLSTDNGSTYKDKVSMTQTSAIFDINGMSNNNYNCKLKGYYEENDNSDTIPVTGIEVDNWDVKLEVGQTKQLNARVIPENATNQNVNWFSNNTSVATVNSTGLIEAVKAGYAKITATTEDGNIPYDVHVNVSAASGGGSSNNLTTDKTSYTINPTEMLNISYTTSASIPSSCAWELRQNGSYLCSAYRDTGSGKIVCYTGSLNTGTYNNITLVAKEYQTDGYVDIATSNVFSITVSGSSSGGSDSGSGGGGSTVNDEYALSCTSDYILDKMYPMGQSHEAIPNGNITGWKYNSRWENQYRPTAVAHSCGQSGCPGTGVFQALGCWSNIYRVEGTPFSQNTGVEMKDIKVYGWYNGAWELVQHLPVPNGNFYAESFNGDTNRNFGDSVKQSSTSKTIILREANKINSENCMYHPLSNIRAFDTKYQYIYTCIDLRKVKWDENGIDDRDQTHYCSNCGGDWWLKEGLLFHDSWQHNKGVCQPKMIEITNEWRRFSMTTVPQNWQNGFPE